MGDLLMLPSPPLPEDTLVLADMLPTLPELSMLPRERLKLRPMLMLSMDMLDTHMLMVLTLPMPDTHIPMVPTHTTTDMLDTHMPMLHMLLPQLPPELPRLAHPLPGPPLDLLMLPSPLLLEDMLVLADMLPTLPEL